MKLHRITIDSYQALRHIDIKVERPVLLVAGRNEAGKSSIVDALRLALLAQPTRVALKKDFGQLVREGSKVAAIQIDADEFSATVTIGSDGKVTDSLKGKEMPPALGYVLDAQRFATLTSDERRTFLYGLMSVEITPVEIGKRLFARGCEREKVEAIAPLLRAGIEATQKEAANRATLAKGGWKATTHESYGAVKAETWKAPLPAFSGDDAAELTGLDKAIADAEAQLGDAQKRLGIAEHEASKAKEREATLAHLREQAKAHAVYSDLVKKATKELDELNRSLGYCQQKAGTKPLEPKTQLPCPECGAILMDSDDGESLVVWKAPDAAQHDPEAAARIPDLQKAIGVQEKVVARHKQNMDAADQAGHQLKALEDQKPTKVVDPEPIRGTAATLRAEIETKRQAELQAAHAALDAAGKLTKDAKRYHNDVIGWSQIADALAPDGIPGELLAEALKPINDRLAQSAVETGWKQVRIAADMGITCDGREYRMESESAQWRADAQIAEAVSHLSGLKTVVLDRIDCLDMTGRSDALGWLDMLADAGEIESAIVLGTLRSIPAELPDTFQAVWLEKGAVVEREQEREAA